MSAIIRSLGPSFGGPRPRGVTQSDLDSVGYGQEYMQEGPIDPNSIPSGWNAGLAYDSAEGRANLNEVAGNLADSFGTEYTPSTPYSQGPFAGTKPHVFRSESGSYQQAGIPVGHDIQDDIAVIMKPDGTTTNVPMSFMDYDSRAAVWDNARPMYLPADQREKAQAALDTHDAWRQSQQPPAMPGPMMSEEFPSGADLSSPLPDVPGEVPLSFPSAEESDELIIPNLPQRAPQGRPSGRMTQAQIDARREQIDDARNAPARRAGYEAAARATPNVLTGRPPQKPVAQKPAAQAPAAPLQQAAAPDTKPPLEAGPESLRPAPGEERAGAAAPAAAQAKAKPVDVTPRQELGDRFANTVWSAYGTAYEQLGFTKDQLRAAYAAAIKGGATTHKEALEAAKIVLADMQAAHKSRTRQYWAQQGETDATARRMGMDPGMYRFGVLLSNATPGERVGLLAAAHAANPNAGWGNALAYEMRNQSQEQQAARLGGAGGGAAQQQTGFDRIREEAGKISARGPAPGVIFALRDLYAQTPDGQRAGGKPGASNGFVLSHATPLYLRVHGQDLSDNPDANQFVQDYMGLWDNYYDWLKAIGQHDTPENQGWWKKYKRQEPHGFIHTTTGRPLINTTTEGPAGWAYGAGGSVTMQPTLPAPVAPK